MDFRHPVEALIPGVRGKVLEVLLRATQPMSINRVARESGSSVAQTSAVLDELENLGVVEWQSVPPSLLYSIVETNLVVDSLRQLMDARATVLDYMREQSRQLIPEAAVCVFGSFARGDDHSESDIDVAFVWPDEYFDDVELDDEHFDRQFGWQVNVHRHTGTVVGAVTYSASEVTKRLTNGSPLWKNIQREHIAVGTRPLDEVQSGAQGGRSGRKEGSNKKGAQSRRSGSVRRQSSRV